MGKKAYCSHCIAFQRRTSRNWGTRVLEVLSCVMCHERHCREVDGLRTKLTSLQRVLDEKQDDYILEMERLTSKYMRELNEQADEHEQSLSDLKLQSSLQMMALEGSYESTVQFLQVPRNAIPGDAVVLLVGGLEINAHCTILAARSPFLLQMIERDTSGKSTKVIKIDDILPPVLEAAVDFCYSGEVAFSELVPPDELLKVAHRFELDLLTKFCEDELCRRLSVDNVPQKLKRPLTFRASRLQEEVGKVFEENFATVKSRVYKIIQGLESKPIPDSDPRDSVDLEVPDSEPRDSVDLDVPDSDRRVAEGLEEWTDILDD